MIDLDKLTYENVLKCLIELGSEFVNCYFIKGDDTYVISEVDYNYRVDAIMTPIITFHLEFRPEITYIVGPGYNNGKYTSLSGCPHGGASRLKC